MRICLRGCARAMCIPILTSATVKPALARRVPVVPGRPCPSRPSRRRVRRARHACRHRRPRPVRRPRPAHGDPHSPREPGSTDVADTGSRNVTDPRLTSGWEKLSRGQFFALRPERLQEEEEEEEFIRIQRIL